MGRNILFIVLLLPIIGLMGCEAKFLPTRREIDDLQMVQVVGIDRSADNPGRMMVTIVSRKVSDGGQYSMEGGGESERSGGSKALIESAEGDTAFDAVRNIQTHSDKTVFWGHTEYYLIGEEAAKENITKYIDFFNRDHELRLESKIFIVKGLTAKELIEQASKSDFFIFDKLESLGRNIRLLSSSEEMEMSDLMRSIDNHHSSARIPCIILTSRERTGKKKVPDVESDGYAIITDFKLVGYIDRDISRGLNLITNNVGSSIVVVKDPEGRNASLEIIRSKTEVIPHFTGDSLESVTLKTKVTSNLGEIQSQVKVIDEKTVHYMNAQQSEVLKKEMENVIYKVLDMKSDCLEICDRIRLKRPLKWHKIESRWMEIFPRLKIDVQVDSVIERTYDLKEPSGFMRKE